MSKTIEIQIQGNLVWKWGRSKQGNYIAVCPSLAQTVQAGKFSDLLETMNEAIDSTLRELFSSGDLDAFLKDRGWRAADLPSKNTRRPLHFDVPFDLKGVRERDLEEALR